MTQKKNPKSAAVIQSLSGRQSHSSSRQDLCGTAALCRKPFLRAVAPVRGSETRTIPPRFPPSAPPLPCADPDLSADSPLNSLLGLFESHTGVKTGICRIKDFDWLSGNALESSGVMGGKTRGRKTDGEKLRRAEKMMNWDNYGRGGEEEEEEAAASDLSYNHLQQWVSVCMCVKTGKQGK